MDFLREMKEVGPGALGPLGSGLDQVPRWGQGWDVIKCHPLFFFLGGGGGEHTKMMILRDFSDLDYHYLPRFG